MSLIAAIYGALSRGELELHATKTPSGIEVELRPATSPISSVACLERTLLAHLAALGPSQPASLVDALPIPLKAGLARVWTRDLPSMSEHEWFAGARAFLDESPQHLQRALDLAKAFVEIEDWAFRDPAEEDERTMAVDAIEAAAYERLKERIS